MYKGINKAFPIGKLNSLHWINHGLKPSQLRFARYCTPDRTIGLSEAQKHYCRNSIRDRLGINKSQTIVSFFGKLIPKKTELLQAIPFLSNEFIKNVSFCFIGSGELLPSLKDKAKTIESFYGIKSFFPGFINQSLLVDWYLASDVVVLPSRRAGETWGLVVNEALQAGSSVVVSEAVGCSADFGHLERFRTIPVGSKQMLAQALMELATYPRSFDWARDALAEYSIDAAASALASGIATVP